jgi:hypothetical protein
LHPAEESGEFARIGSDRALGDHPALWVDRSRHMHLAVRVDTDGGENRHDCPSRDAPMKSGESRTVLPFG